MRFRSLLCMLLLGAALAVPGCAKDKGDKEKGKKGKPNKPAIADASTDTSFQSFIGRLKQAVAKRDRQMIAQLMAQDFGWRWEQPPPGTPFDYWDQNNMWPELERLVHERFTPSGDFMVSPPAFAADSNFRGPRCGMRMVNGAWRFAYFVTGEDVLQ